MSSRQPNCFLAADTAVIVGNEVLLVRRHNEPFRGMWCLPGGFVNPEEKVVDGALRELKEETAVDAVNVRFFGAYGDPGRDPRGRTVSFVYWVRAATKPQATAGDDAAEYQWFDLDHLPNMAFDHGKIMDELRSRLHELA